MTKTLSKILAVVLAVCMLFAVPVIANAEETATFALTGSLDSVTGNWDTDYAEMVVIELRGGVKAVSEGAVVTIGTGDSLSNIKTAKISTADCTFATSGGGNVWISIPMVSYIAHAETYNFYFAEGTFVNKDGALSEAVTVTVTGNDIIETLDVEHVSTKPIEKLIDWMYTWGAEGFWLDVINFIVRILEWFLYI